MAQRGGVSARLTSQMNPAVFIGSAALVIAFVIAGGGFTDATADFFQTLQENITRFFGWYYVLVVTGILVLTFAILASPARNVRLGGPEATPEFSRFGWFGMLFAAGMGIGLVYFGVAEPLYHYASPLDAEPEGLPAVTEAMRISFFHWGLHAWGIYIVLALAVAYAHFNRGLPLAPRSVLEPLIGERIHGPIGDLTDIVCTVGTLLGVATSLGLGAMQINASLASFFGWPETTLVQIALIAAITLIATISVVSGVKSGVQMLSRVNLWLVLGLMVFVLAVGPTLYVVELFVSALGRYLQNLPQMSLYLDPGADSQWQTTWTLFYWGWWISWSPFVGIFVARISYGRTIKEFILGVLLVPTLLTFLWFAIFGGTGLSAQRAEEGANLLSAVRENEAASLQAMLATLPFAQISTIVATVVILLFFVTSSDSGSLVDDMVTSGGDPHPPKAQRVFWAVSEGAVAATLLLLGGLTAIRNAAISLGLPMSILLIAAAIALWRNLQADPAARTKRGRPRAADLEKPAKERR
ncbi:BCCT family transporter [Rhodosalinus halophilus]|uniref:BCCT family transporter n=1 Tax=Rhodosalinus halophilus TaxID=2259333 RepID=A0A365U5Z5_9RHOB|nr:BCCT family transporter [Rhodosalinus halophilus]RBI83844.1 BCCT family transporter [Rhodosalinus halophilus]